MQTDPLAPATIIEFIISFGGSFLFIAVPGNALTRLLKIEIASILESAVFSIALGFILLHFLAYAVFVSRSDLIWFAYAGACLICASWVLYRACKEQAWKKLGEAVSGEGWGYWAIYGLLIAFILVYYDYAQQGTFVKDEKGVPIGFIAEWDFYSFLYPINELKHYFLPLDNPVLPGEPPLYHSWMGNLLPVFLTKYLGIDQLHAYFVWSFLLFHIAFILFVHYLTGRFTKDPWVPMFAVGLFFLMPRIMLGIWVHRTIAGIFFIFCIVIFMVKYFSTKQKFYIALSIAWAFLYGVKGNFMLAILPGLAVFYLQTLFPAFPKWDAQVFKILALGAVLPISLFWLSRHYFGLTVLPDPEPFIFDLARVYSKLEHIIILTGPLLAIYGLYYYRRKKNGEKIFSPLEMVLWCGWAGMVIFSALAAKYMEGNVITAVLSSFVLPVPIVLHRLTPNPLLYRNVGIACMVLFSILAWKPQKPTEDTNYVSLSSDELAMIRFFREKTSVDSVVLYNVTRYTDRPGIMSSLSYRKSFIDEAERYANIYDLVLDQRLYDYWDFLLCDCSLKDRKYFFSKYPNVNYVVEYDGTFLKKINPLVGMPSLAYGILIKNKDPHLFQKVFHQGAITVYAINRQTVGSKEHL